MWSRGGEQAILTLRAFSQSVRWSVALFVKVPKSTWQSPVFGLYSTCLVHVSMTKFLKVQSNMCDMVILQFLDT